jgi:beta-phosphoglucomutase-like phosphatase (HAD superfamily)
MVLEALIFDIDQRLALHGHLYPGMETALADLHLHYRLFVCSYNPLASHYLARAGVLHYFTEVVVRLTQTKGRAISDLLHRRNLLPTQVLFFDNDPRNIATTRAAGIPSQLVPPTGLTPVLLQQWLAAFSVQKTYFRRSK